MGEERRQAKVRVGCQLNPMKKTGKEIWMMRERKQTYINGAIRVMKKREDNGYTGQFYLI